MRFRYTSEHLEFLKAGYASMKVEDLVLAFNEKFGLSMPVTAIKSTLKNHQNKCGRKPAERLIERHRLFTPEQEEFLRDNYKIHTIPELTILFNEKYGTDKAPQQLKTFCFNHSIISGRTGCFEKGSKPWNTGTKGLTKPNTGNFKKGQIPVNLKPIGHERTGKRARDGFIFIKIAEKNPYTGAPTRYKHKHVHVWEQANGPIPEGMVVAFRDGDQLNNDISNLMLISRAELLRLNQYGYKETPEELKPTVLAVAKLEVKTFGLLRG